MLIQNQEKTFILIDIMIFLTTDGMVQQYQQLTNQAPGLLVYYILMSLMQKQVLCYGREMDLDLLVLIN